MTRNGIHQNRSQLNLSNETIDSESGRSNCLNRSSGAAVGGTMLQECKPILKQINYIQLVTFVAKITDGTQARTTLVPLIR